MTDDSRLRTSDGIDLAADVAVPDDARAAAVLTHPHPDYGGDRHALVPDALFRELPSRGIAALRFDFRGAGGSGGAHSDGRDEPLDVAAAIDALIDHVDETVPLIVVGYSFGADVVLRVDHARMAGRVVIAPPLRWLGDGPVLDERPLLVLVAEHDQFTPPAAVMDATQAWSNTSVTVVPRADHFMHGATPVVAGHIEAFVDVVGGGRPRDSSR